MNILSTLQEFPKVKYEVIVYDKQTTIQIVDFIKI